MSTVASTLGEFIAAWNAGERPRARDYLARVPSADREALADQIESFLMLAPEPEYGEAAWADITSPASVRAAAAAAMEPEPWPSLLPRLRARAGLTIAQVAERLGVEPQRRAKAERRLAEMEGGELDPSRPSRTLLERLSTILGVSAAALDWRGEPFGEASVAPALLRATSPVAPGQAIDLLADGLLTDDEWDEVDELFLGGRE